MAPPPGPYSGTSALALVARASALSFGIVYGSIKLKIFKSPMYASCNETLADWKAQAKSREKTEAKGHH